MALNDSDVCVADADFIAGIYLCIIADRCGVSEITRAYICETSNSGVIGPRRVAGERSVANSGVRIARGVEVERIDPTGGVVEASGVAEERSITIGSV